MLLIWETVGLPRSIEREGTPSFEIRGSVASLGGRRRITSLTDADPRRRPGLQAKPNGTATAVFDIVESTFVEGGVRSVPPHPLGVTTHRPNESALKMDGAQACYPYLAARVETMPWRVGRRGGQ